MTAATSLLFRMIGVDGVTPMAGKVGSSFERIGLAAVAVSGLVVGSSLKMAMDWESAMQRVVTGAGEATGPKGIGMVSAEALKMLGPLGLTAKSAAAAIYDVESAGFRGADGLRVFEAAAKGSKVSQSDLLTTSDAVTTILNSYRLGSDGAARAVNNLIGAEI